MTLDKAIDTLIVANIQPRQGFDENDRREAISLGIEALRRVRMTREVGPEVWMPPLSGETWRQAPLAGDTGGR